MPEQHFTKQDWSLFSKKIAGWQEAYIAQLIDSYIQLLNTDTNPSDRFWELENRIKHDRKSPGVLLDMSRSNMLYNILTLINNDVITLGDLNDFSDDLKDTIRYLTERN